MKKDLSLQKAVDICKAAEMASQHMKTLVDSATHEAHAISKQQKGKIRQKGCQDLCGRYGYLHTGKQHQCPPMGQKCDKCGKLNHFAKVCKNGQETEVNEVEEDEADDEDFHLYSIESNLKNYQWVVPIQIYDSIIPVRLDTGADVNILSYKELLQLRKDQK